MSICRWLEAEGIRTSRASPTWIPTNLNRILTSRVYLGEVKSGQYARADAHPALIDRTLWEMVQSIETARPVQASLRLLSGLARCASCRYRMHTRDGKSKGGEMVRYYQCHRRHASGICTRTAAIQAGALEAFVCSAVERRVSRQLRLEPDAVTAGLQAKLEQAERAVATYWDNDWVEAIVGPARYAEGLRRRMEAVRRAGVVAHAPRTRRVATVSLAEWRAMSLD